MAAMSMMKSITNASKQSETHVAANQNAARWNASRLFVMSSDAISKSVVSVMIIPLPLGVMRKMAMNGVAQVHLQQGVLPKR